MAKSDNSFFNACQSQILGRVGVFTSSVGAFEVVIVLGRVCRDSPVIETATDQTLESELLTVIANPNWLTTSA